MKKRFTPTSSESVAKALEWLHIFESIPSEYFCQGLSPSEQCISRIKTYARKNRRSNIGTSDPGSNL
jgi:hypothetical protein